MSLHTKNTTTTTKKGGGSGAVTLPARPKDKGSSKASTEPKNYAINEIEKAIKTHKTIVDQLYLVGGGWEQTLEGIICAQLQLENGTQSARCETNVYKGKGTCDIEIHQRGGETNTVSYCEFKALKWAEDKNNAGTYGPTVSIQKFLEQDFRSDVWKICCKPHEIQTNLKKGTKASWCAVGFFTMKDYLTERKTKSKPEAASLEEDDTVDPIRAIQKVAKGVWKKFNMTEDFGSVKPFVRKVTDHVLMVYAIWDEGKPSTKPMLPNYQPWIDEQKAKKAANAKKKSKEDPDDSDGSSSSGKDEASSDGDDSGIESEDHSKGKNKGSTKRKSMEKSKKHDSDEESEPATKKSKKGKSKSTTKTTNRSDESSDESDVATKKTAKKGGNKKPAPKNKKKTEESSEESDAAPVKKVKREGHDKPPKKKATVTSDESDAATDSDESRKSGNVKSKNKNKKSTDNSRTHAKAADKDAKKKRKVAHDSEEDSD